jgi:hypothetical protein
MPVEETWVRLCSAAVRMLQARTRRKLVRTDECHSWTLLTEQPVDVGLEAPNAGRELSDGSGGVAGQSEAGSLYVIPRYRGSIALIERETDAATCGRVVAGR